MKSQKQRLQITQNCYTHLTENQKLFGHLHLQHLIRVHVCIWS